MTAETRQTLGFGDWLRWQISTLGVSQADLARRTGLASPTIATFMSGRTRRPKVNAGYRLAAVLDVPAMVMAVVSGYADRAGFGESEEAVWVATMPWIGGMEPKQRSIEWSRLGRAAIAKGLLTDPARQQLTESRWAARGVSLPNEMEIADGIRLLDTMHGAELSLLIEGAGGTPSDVIAIAAVMGRIGPGLCRSWGCESDWDAWAEIGQRFLGPVDGDVGKFHAKEYMMACRAIPWSEVKPSTNENPPSLKVSHSGMNPLSKTWAFLSHEQQQVLRGLLRTWGY